MEYARNTYGICTGYAWTVNGICKEYVWNMQYGWNMYVICMICLEYAWHMHGACSITYSNVRFKTSLKVFFSSPVLFFFLGCPLLCSRSGNFSGLFFERAHRYKI